MNRKQSEFFLGVSIGLILAILFSVKALAADLTPEEEKMIVDTVFLEAGNQSLTGKRLVISVILNRVDSDQFPDDVKSVLSEPGQFSTYKNLDNATPTWTDELALKLEEEKRINTGVYFRTKKYGCGSPLFQYGDHFFSTIN